MSLFRALQEDFSTLEELAEANKKPLPNAELPEVLLLHGYFLGNRSLQGLAVHLQHSYEVACIDYPSLRNLEKTTQRLLEEVKAITDLRGEAISLIGHSMGGLLATRIAQEYPSAIKKVIALGTPFHGTYGAYTQYPLGLVVPIPSVKQMFPKSRFIKELQERGFPESVHFTSIYSSDDFVVMPWKSSILPQKSNTQNVQLSDVGHLGLLGKKVGLLIERYLNYDYPLIK